MTPPTERTSAHRNPAGITRIRRALLYSIAGLESAFRTEPAFRLEVAGAAVLAPIAVVLPASLTQTALLLGALLLVLVVELLNSAVEATVDRISLDHHELSRKAKDVGSAAVFVSLVNCAVVWGLVLYDIFG